MSRDFPAMVDPLQLAKSRRSYSGRWPMAKLQRLVEAIERPEGDVEFDVSFDIDDLGIPFVEMRINASPVLLCQQTLEPFAYPIDRVVRLGMIESEHDDVSLPADYEPLVLTGDSVKLMELVEDELLLSLPLVAKSQDEPVSETFGAASKASDQAGSSPFAVLAGLKETKK